MKARLTPAVDFKNPDRKLYCIMISLGKGKKPIPAAVNGTPFFTEDKLLAIKHIDSINEKLKTRRQA